MPGLQCAGWAGGFLFMKTPKEYEKEIADLSELVEKMKFQLQRALESMLELIAEVNRLNSKHES